ncbi:metalloprotease family protein [Enterococcus hirae]|uniref:metalloprotease family protein n=1 Tax=Enterococcus hirae TaxID=1354 RepID=UPI001376A297|nr:metalloprotease family protein [Enterococcus hirae]NBA57114.1 hypothetical protein [Enterococcus hirae]
MLILLIIIYLISFYLILLLHEGIHFFFAKLFRYDPVLVKINFVAFKIIYTNNNKPLENLIIAIMPAIILTTLGIIIPLNYYTLILKLMCLANFINLLPITGDGEIIILSLFKIFKK